MPSLDRHEPTAGQLALAQEAFSVSLLSFSRALEKLHPDEFLPRYHRLRLKLLCNAVFEIRPIFVTVRRVGSKVGAENYYTVPFFPDPMTLGTEALYELLSFDSFNLPFESLTVELCRAEDYSHRRVSRSHIERAKRFSFRMG